MRPDPDPDPDPLSAPELAKMLPAERQADFLRFLKSGEASDEFMQYLETDRPAQVALESHIDRDSLGWSEAAHLLHITATSKPAKTGLLSSIKDRFNKKLTKPFDYKNRLTVRMQDGSLADIPYAVSLSVADKEKYKSFKHPPEGHVTTRLRLLLRYEALKHTPATFAAAAGEICEKGMLDGQDVMQARYGLRILDVAITDVEFMPGGATATAAAKARHDNAENTRSNIRTLREGLEKAVPVKKPLQLKKPTAKG